MTNDKGSQNGSGTSSGKSKKGKILEPFVLKPDEVYSRQYLMKVMNLSKNTFMKWHDRGLKKLNTNTAQDLYLGIDLITLFRSSS